MTPSGRTARRCASWLTWVSDLDAWPVAVVVAARRGRRRGFAGGAVPGCDRDAWRPRAPASGRFLFRRWSWWCAASTLTRRPSSGRLVLVHGRPTRFTCHELLELVRAEGIPADNQVDVEALVPESVMRSVLVRLGRLADPAPALAAAAAVLGEGAPLRQAASLAGLDDGSAETAADTLAAAHILQTRRSARLRPSADQDGRARRPARAGTLARASPGRRVVRAEGASVEAVAAHLLVCRASGRPGGRGNPVRGRTAARPGVVTGPLSDCSTGPLAEPPASGSA